MMTEVVGLFNINKFNIILDSWSLSVAKICNLIKKVKKKYLKSSNNILSPSRLRGIAQTVWSCPTLPGSLQWVSGAHQLRSAEQRSAVRLIPTQAIVQLQFLVIAGLRCIQLSSLQSAKAWAWHRRNMAESDPKKAGSIYEFSATDIDGNQVCKSWSVRTDSDCSW